MSHLVQAALASLALSPQRCKLLLQLVHRAQRLVVDLHLLRAPVEVLVISCTSVKDDETYCPFSAPIFDKRPSLSHSKQEILVTLRDDPEAGIELL